MNMCRRLSVVVILIMVWTCTALYGQDGQSVPARLQPDFVNYINLYKNAAISQQREHKIPASITMAQGLLESGAGKSELATKANNHFGIKCTSDWKGETYRHDDDRRNECFRKYKHAEASWEDHSLFLLRPRYKELFSLELTDYKGWAHGLSRCGYATDPTYPAKLIRIIEDYRLDLLVAESGAEHPDYKKTTPTNEERVSTDTLHLDESITAADTIDIEEEHTFEEVAKMNDVTFYHDHRSGTQNGTRYIIAEEGESYSSLAYFLNIREKQLRKYNDATDGRMLQKGDRVYLFYKQKYAPKRYTYYYVRKGDTAWSIAQKFGFRMKSIYTLNGIPEGTPLVTRQQLRLRK